MKQIITSLLQQNIITSFLPNNLMTNLERIVSIRAINNSVITNISSQYSLQTMYIETMHLNFHSSNYIVSILVLLIYLQLKYNLVLENNDIQLKEFPIYNKYKNIISQLCLIILLVFTREIENAT